MYELPKTNDETWAAYAILMGKALAINKDDMIVALFLVDAATHLFRKERSENRRDN